MTSLNSDRERDLLTLRPLIVSLSRRNPPDFYEIHGLPILIFMCVVSLSAVAQALDERAFWIQQVIAVLAFFSVIVFGAAPPLMFNRVIGMPRWAHILATVEPFEFEPVKDVLERALQDKPQMQRDIHEGRVTGLHVYAAAVSLTDDVAQFRRKKRSMA